MPQMHPLMWLILFIASFLALSFMFSLLFFQASPKPLISSKPSSPLSLSWKW